MPNYYLTAIRNCYQHFIRFLFCLIPFTYPPWSCTSPCWAFSCMTGWASWRPPARGWTCVLQIGLIRSFSSLLFTKYKCILGRISAYQFSSQILLAFICVIFMERQHGCQHACDACAKYDGCRICQTSVMGWCQRAVRLAKVDGGQRAG